MTNTTRNPLDFEMTLVCGGSEAVPRPVWFFRGDQLSGPIANWGTTDGIYIEVWHTRRPSGFWTGGYSFSVFNSQAGVTFAENEELAVVRGRVTSPAPQDLYEAARAAFAQVLAGWDEDNQPNEYDYKLWQESGTSA